MENNLDKYFRDNLHDRKFEMKEEYWLGAEKMLDAQDNRRKRRVIFWWFGGGLGMLLLVGFGIWIFGKNGFQEPIVTRSNTSITSPKTENASSQIIENEKPEIAETETPESASSNVKHLSNAQILGKATTQPRSEKQIDEEKIARSLSSTSKETKADNKNSIGQENNTQSIAVESVKLADNFELPSEISTSETLKTEAKHLLDSNSIWSNENVSERRISPDFLALLTCYVSGDFSENDLATTVQKIDVANPHRLHFGVLASQLLIPNPGKDEKTFIGQQFGLVIKYDFRNEFYLSSGLQYLHRTGSFDASKTATQRNYRFGLEVDTLLLRPTSLHYFNLPILLGWEHRRQQLEVGVRLDFLTGVRGETGSYQKQGEPPVKVFKAEKSGWITTDGYRHFVPTLQFNYRYKLLSHWSIGLSANYTMGGILDPNYEAPIGSFLLKETEKFQLGAHLVYLIN